MSGHGEFPAVAPVAAVSAGRRAGGTGFRGRAGCLLAAWSGQVPRGVQTLILASAVRVGMRQGAFGKPWRALVL